MKNKITFQSWTFICDDFDMKLFQHEKDFILQEIENDKDTLLSGRIEGKNLIIESMDWRTYIKIDSEKQRATIVQTEYSKDEE